MVIILLSSQLWLDNEWFEEQLMIVYCMFCCTILIICIVTTASAIRKSTNKTMHKNKTDQSEAWIWITWSLLTNHRSDIKWKLSQVEHNQINMSHQIQYSFWKIKLDIITRTIINLGYYLTKFQVAHPELLRSYKLKTVNLGVIFQKVATKTPHFL